MAGERDRLMAQPLHQAAIARDHIGIMIDEVVAEPRIQHPLGECHADSSRKSLSEWTRRGFDALGVTIFGVAWSLRAPLTEALQLLQRHRFIAGEVQERV